MTKATEFISFGPDYEKMLPTEILIQIFESLHPADRFIASQTCKRFLEVSEHYKFINDQQLNFSGCSFSDNTSPAKDFDGSFRTFANLSFTDVEFNDCQNFWLKHGAAVDSLSITSCDITEKKLKMILKATCNLTQLKIQNSRELFMSGRLFGDDNFQLEHVTLLSLPLNRYLSDSLFSRIVKVMPKLSSLDLSGNSSISFHRGLYKKFYPRNCDDEVGSESVFTFHFIWKFVKSRAEKIKELNFNGTLIDGNTLEMLSEIENLQLTALHLRECNQLTNDGFISLITLQPQLVHLDLTFSVRITDASLMQVCESLKSLKVLKLRRCRALTDVSVKMIADLPFLEVLDISDCEALTSAAIIDGIASKKNEILLELYLSALNLNEKAITKVAENLSNLRVLDLSFCMNDVDDVCLQMILKNLVWLRELNLDSCERISDAGLTGMAMKEKLADFERQQENKHVEAKLEPIVSGMIQAPAPPVEPSVQPQVFKISLRSKAEEEIVGDAMRKKAMMQMAMGIDLQEQESSSISIARLRGLRVLKLGGCNKISDVSLIYNFKLPELKEINLSQCQQISMVGIKALVDNCPSLEVIDLSACYNISDKCIELIASKLPRLTSLNISRCFQLTDYSLDYIALNCRRIRNLNVLYCKNMSDEPHLRLANAPSLKTVSFSKQSAFEASPSIPTPPRMLLRNIFS